MLPSSLLVTPTFFPPSSAWKSLAIQIFIKPTRVTALHRVQKNYFTTQGLTMWSWMAQNHADQTTLQVRAASTYLPVLGLEVCAGSATPVLLPMLGWLDCLPCTGASDQVRRIWPCGVSGPWLPQTLHRTLVEFGSSPVQCLPKDLIRVSDCFMG